MSDENYTQIQSIPSFTEDYHILLLKNYTICWKWLANGKLIQKLGNIQINQKVSLRLSEIWLVPMRLKVSFKTEDNLILWSVLSLYLMFLDVKPLLHICSCPCKWIRNSKFSKWGWQITGRTLKFVGLQNFIN